MLTLIEAAKMISGDVLRSTIIEIYARSSAVLSVLPFIDIPGNAYRYNRESALPGIGFRGVNEGFTASVGVINPVTEPIVIAGGDLDVDKFIIDSMGASIRAAHEEAKVKALAHFWTNQFIKGDSESNPRGFDGLQKRLTGAQILQPDSPTSGGDAPSLYMLDAAIDAVDDPTHILMNKVLARRLTAAARNPSIGGYIQWTTDAFGRRIMSYNDLPILVVGDNGDIYKSLDFTEANPGGGTAASSSIYVASMRSDKLVGLQNGIPDVRDLGELQEKSAFRTRVEWYNGIGMFHPRAASRYRGIKNAAWTV